MNLHDSIAALIHKGVTDAAPLCDSIKQVQKFTGKGLTPASPPDKIQPSTQLSAFDEVDNYLDTAAAAE